MKKRFKRAIMLFMIMTLCLNISGCSDKTADKDFLKTMEESITSRMENSGDTDRSTLVNTELAYLEEFKDLEFKDEKLKELCSKYLEGLNTQKESLTKEHEYERQIKWQEGLVARYEVLKDLHDNYDFLSDNKEFVGTYVSKCEDEQKLLKAYNEIEEDIGNQMSAKEYSFVGDLDENKISTTLKNNTSYTFSTIFEITLLDKNKTILDTITIYVENIKPNTSYDVSSYVSDLDKAEDVDWENYYGDIIY